MFHVRSKAVKWLERLRDGAKTIFAAAQFRATHHVSLGLITPFARIENRASDIDIYSVDLGTVAKAMRSNIPLARNHSI